MHRPAGNKPQDGLDKTRNELATRMFFSVGLLAVLILFDVLFLCNGGKIEGFLSFISRILAGFWLGVGDVFCQNRASCQGPDAFIGIGFVTIAAVNVFLAIKALGLRKAYRELRTLALWNLFISLLVLLLPITGFIVTNIIL